MTAAERFGQIDDQTTSAGLSLSMTCGRTSSSSSRSHDRPPGRSGSVNASKTTKGGAGWLRFLAPTSITTGP